MAKRKHPAAATTEVHTPFRWLHTNAAARVAENVGAVNADDVGCQSFQQDDGSVWTAIATGTGAGKWLLGVPPATTSLPGTLSAADKTKLNGISTGADVTSAALVTAGTTTSAVAATANKLELAPVSMGTITTGTTQPISFTDALFTGLVTGGTAVGSAGTLGVIASAFASSGAEVGTGAGQGGLGSAASSTQPYNATDFAGGRFHCDLFKTNSEPLVLSDVLTTAGVSFPASVAAPVVFYLARRTDLGTDLKWRGWFYFRNQATGNLTPITPDISVANVTLRIPQVFFSKDVPTSSLYTPIAALGSAEVVFGVVGDVKALGVVAAGVSGRVSDAAHVHVMPTLNQVSVPTADVPMAGFGLTGARRATIADGDVMSRASGSGPFGVRFFEDWLNGDATGQNKWTNVVAGTGTVTAVVTGGSAKRPGVVRLSRGITAVSRAGTFLGTTGGSWVLGPDGNWYLYFGFNIATLSDGTNTFRFVIGLGDTSAAGDQVNGVFVVVDSTVSSALSLEARASSVGAPVAGTFAVTGATWVDCRVKKADGGTVFGLEWLNPTTHAWVDQGISISTNIPTGNLDLFAKLDGTVGAANRTVDIDYVGVDIEFPLGRT